MGVLRILRVIMFLDELSHVFKQTSQFTTFDLVLSQIRITQYSLRTLAPYSIYLVPHLLAPMY
jgi:hypothetical protein